MVFIPPPETGVYPWSDRLVKQSYLVEIMPGMQVDCLGHESLGVSLGDSVVITCDKHTDCGVVIRVGTGGARADTSRDSQTQRRRGDGKTPTADDKAAEIIRLMTDADSRKAEDNESRAQSMFKTAQRKIREHHLVMKLINCHYSLDKNIAFFQFSAEGRVDFRGLVRDLSGALRTRIELRQIGVRDEAGIIGGIGVCGQPFCCARFLNRFQSVNVKMAKIQRLSLNPASVSGGCGRLKCCLRYEVDGYKEMCRGLPRTGARCVTPDGCGRVVDCNALTQKARVRLDDGNAQFKDFDVADVSPAPPSQGPREEEKRDQAGKGDRSNQDGSRGAQPPKNGGENASRRNPRNAEGKGNRRRARRPGGRPSQSGGETGSSSASGDQPA
ncbi:MAG: regulatory iron-sulfur-containing complex subunit RicT [Lentisphaeria bacterium]|nr:regulatory iron-sulfur-containing complex subunit RicT [Lentisphaeria bacterium]